MNGLNEAKEKILNFLDSDKKVMLVTGTYIYKKHKIIIAMLNKYRPKSKILFRVNGMDNLTNDDFVGFAGLKKNPKSGEVVKIGKCYYNFDSLNKTTWNRSCNDNDFSILYPLDTAMRKNPQIVIEDLVFKTIGKVFLVSWFDKNFDYDDIAELYDEHVIYDCFEDDSVLHEKILKY